MQHPNIEKLGGVIQDITRDKGTALTTLPLNYARAVLSATNGVDYRFRVEALRIIRGWTRYAKQHSVPGDDPFVIRYHISQFAAETFGTKREPVELKSLPITDVSHDGHSYQDILGSYIAPQMLEDPEVAIIGGAARVALKMHAGVSIDTELPINDVDMVVTTGTDIAEKSAGYGVDLTGAKVVDGDVLKALSDLITNFDCTMNQVAIHKGRLYFTDKALEDVREGNIRLIAKNDPLFGSEGVVAPDGHVYLNKNGFYRGLSFLLRGKGERLIVSKENIEAEKDNIGRYWLVLLYVKILTMKDDRARHVAVANWYDIAVKIGSTEASSPEEFFDELIGKYPETRMYDEKKDTFDVNSQVRWIIGKLTNKAIREISEPEIETLPDTYTETPIELSGNVVDYDYDFESFLRKTRFQGIAS